MPTKSGELPPQITIPSGPPPKRLVVKDLKVGAGPVLGRRANISTRYVSYRYETREIAEDRWRSGFEIFFGPGWEVRGWEKGLPGMRVGGIRELIVPARLAYKTSGPLVYEVKLLALS